MFRIFYRPIQYVADAIDPFLSLRRDDGQGAEIVRWHRWIIRAGAATGVINSLAWLALILLCLVEEGVKDDGDLAVLLMTRVIAISFFVPGTFLGISAVLAVAPAWFLRGPGERWIKFIGTGKIAVARLVCLAAAPGHG